MIREFSAGGVVFNKNGQVLITQNSMTFKWGFPKGQLDGDEKSPEAALREVREEGGIEARIIEKVEDSKFFYVREGQKVFKTVAYFLMEYISGDIEDHDFEVSEAKWVEVDEALNTLNYKADKEILKKAVDQKQNLTL